ncbi:SRPBCC family protein [Nocardioides jensenii]|uniref:SRPBCC family protein n=1 Tax=Nocardioides jensenii TaxID=1843 RepID=UPI00082D1C83|nr:SRPBCC family protein [Nocardioides jensenii]
MSQFNVARSTVVVADPPRIHGLIDDLHQWQQWSPWEGIDPELQREYSGADVGTGARYTWSGNKKAGSGSMEITDSVPDRIDVTVRFLKPFKATNAVTFTLAPVAAGTEVTWSMSGEQRGLMGIVGRFLPMDKLIGKDFEKGLASLKARAEQPA